MKKIMLFIGIAGLMACTGEQPTAEATAKSTPQETTVEANSAEQTDTTAVDGTTAATASARATVFNGTLEIPPERLATVTLTMGGVVRTLSLLPGSYVSQGTLLATLENPEFIQLQQTYLESRAQLNFLEAEYKRQQALSQEEVASQKRLQQSEADWLSMKSRAEASATQLRLLGVDPERLGTAGIVPYLEVKAPISGYLGAVKVNLGSYVQAGEALCELIDKRQALLRLTAYEKDLAGLEVGAPLKFQVNGLGSDTFEATLIAIGQQVDAVNRSVELYAKVKTPHALFRPGMYVSAIVER